MYVMRCLTLKLIKGTLSTQDSPCANLSLSSLIILRLISGGQTVNMIEVLHSHLTSQHTQCFEICNALMNSENSRCITPIQVGFRNKVPANINHCSKFTLGNTMFLNLNGVCDCKEFICRLRTSAFHGTLIDIIVMNSV